MIVRYILIFIFLDSQLEDITSTELLFSYYSCCYYCYYYYYYHHNHHHHHQHHHHYPCYHSYTGYLKLYT